MPNSQTMLEKLLYFVTIGRDYRSHNMVCFWWKILPNVYLGQKRNPSLWLIWKWLIKSVIACVTNSQQLQVFVTIYCAKKEVWDVITDTMIHSHFQYTALHQVLNHLHCISSSALTTFTEIRSVLYMTFDDYSLIRWQYPDTVIVISYDINFL